MPRAASAKPTAETKRGRPTKFRPDFIKQAKGLTALGATDAEIADFLEVGIITLYRWKHAHPAFSEALKRGKELCDEMVEGRLFKKATGYSHPAVKIFQGKTKPVIVPYTEHIPPDTTAAIFWLKNRKPGVWRDRVEHSGPDGEPIQFIMNNRPAKGDEK